MLRHGMSPWISDDGEAFLVAIAESVPAWQRDGLCAEPAYDPDWWFATKRSRTVGERARAVCARCIVQRECLGFAMRNEITEGIWGGASPEQRRELGQRGITADLVEQYGPDAAKALVHHRDYAAIDAWLDSLMAS